MVFRNVYGEIAWKRIIALIAIICITVGILIYFDLFGIFGDHPRKPPSDANLPPAAYTEPIPKDLAPFEGEVTKGTYTCGERVCIELRDIKGISRVIAYPTGGWQFSVGMRVSGSGIQTNNSIKAYYINPMVSEMVGIMPR